MIEKDLELEIRFEDELMINVIKDIENLNNKNNIHSLLQRDIDWYYLVQNAYDHGLLALFYKQINSFYPDLIPENISNILNDFFNENKHKNLILKEELLKILKTLKSNGITAIPYNGLTLAINAYSDPALRQFVKIDIFISKSDVSKVKDILISRGYNAFYNDIAEHFYIKTQNMYIFFNKDENIYINIHWNFNGVLFSFSKGCNYLSQKDNIVTSKIDGSNILNFSPEDQLLIQCVYNANQNWTRLFWIYDIVSLIQTNEINWNMLIDNAEKSGFRRIVLINIFLAKALFGLEIPTEIENYFDSDNQIRNISIKIIKKIFFIEGYPAKISEKALLNFKMRENIVDKFKDSINCLLRPSNLEFRETSLSESFNFFYYIIRPFYLLKRHVLRPLKGNITVEFEPTPFEVIERMFNLAELDSNDIIYDLGCGDGRIVVTAAKKYGTKGFGIDIDNNLIEECRINSINEGVDHLTTFVRQDASETDISQATLVTMYLYPSFIHNKLCPKFKKELSSGTKIISHRYKIANWKPLKTEMMVYKGQVIPLYMWKI